jgi:predicted permease
MNLIHLRQIRGRLARFFGLFNRKRRKEEFAEELESHLALHIEDNLRAGMSPEDARRQALIKLGGVALTQELHREQRGLPMLETLWQDLQFGWRMLRKNPGFTLIAMLTLALGIGANTAIFSIVNAALLRPLPFAQPEQLVFLGETDVKGRAAAVSASNLGDFSRQSQSFEHLAAHRGGSFTLTGGGEPMFISGVIVSPNFFTTLHTPALLGRTFRPEEAQPGADRVAVLSHSLWQRRFASSANSIGQTLTLNGESYSIVGVLPAEFSLWEAEVWTPGFPRDALGNRAERSVGVIGRLKSGVSLTQATAELSTIAQRLGREYPQTNQGWGVRLLPLREAWFGDDRQVLLTLLGVAGFVMLIACVNVSSLLLARASARSREMALRMAIGASRFRLARQALTESLLLAGLGGVAGLLLAHWSLRLIVALIPGNMLQFSIPGGGEAIRIDPMVLLFTLGLFLLAGFGFGLAPMLQTTKVGLSAVLKESGRSATAPTSRLNLRHLLVIVEIALALTLLISAGLLTRSFARLETLERGYNPDNVLNLFLNLPQARYSDGTQRAAFFTRLLERLPALPGVDSAGASALLSARGRAFTIEGQPPPALGQEPKAIHRVVSPNYFQTIQLPLNIGRSFTEQDGANAPGVCLINQTLARQHWPDEDPLGKQLCVQESGGTVEVLTIVGVTGDVKESLDPRTPLGLEPQPTLYRSYLQAPNAGMILSVRTTSDPLSLAATVRHEISLLDQDLPITGLRTAREALAESLARPHFNTIILGCFAGVALLLAIVGVYGVIAYDVSQRTQEIGIRMALGAQRGAVLRLVLAQGMKLASLGVGFGLASAFGLTRLLRTLLFGVIATDPLTFAAMAMLLLLVAGMACWIPARRATTVDPLIALHHE